MERPEGPGFLLFVDKVVIWKVIRAKERWCVSVGILFKALLCIVCNYLLVTLLLDRGFLTRSQLFRVGWVGLHETLSTQIFISKVPNFPTHHLSFAAWRCAGGRWDWAQLCWATVPLCCSLKMSGQGEKPWGKMLLGAKAFSSICLLSFRWVTEKEIISGFY